MKRPYGLIALCLIASLILFSAAGCAQKAANTGADKNEQFKVGFIYVGPVGDEGWSFAHDLGRKYVEKNVPGVTTMAVESVPEGADAERVITQMIEVEGVNMVFTTSMGYEEPVLKIAQKHPEVKFVQLQGHKPTDNVMPVVARDDQSFYLTGMVAGKMTKTNTIGVVESVPAPQCFAALDTFALGARSVNPNVKVRVVWTNSWYDPAKEKEAAKSLIASGADVVAPYADSAAPVMAAVEGGVFTFGSYVDMSKYGADKVLTGFIQDWGPLYADLVKQAMNGTFKGTQSEGSAVNGVEKLAPFASAVPQDVKDLVNAKYEELKSGKWDVNYGPIKDQSGKEVVASGQQMDKDKWFALNWYVDGVVGKPPTK